MVYFVLALVIAALLLLYVYYNLIKLKVSPISDAMDHESFTEGLERIASQHKTSFFLTDALGSREKLSNLVNP